MRTTLFSALIFSLLTSASVAVNAAPAAESSSMTPASTSMAQPSSMASMHEMGDGKVNINMADAQMLQKELAGVGKNKADAIIAYRESNGKFMSVDELIEVKGIGKAILEQNRDKLAIE
ncbi:ComEA family DNA-binding protein [Pseudomonas syringae]|uniref:ComEA family DNA-binding protein n=1 Tax=Pseudomonas syringae TaxID=317 RepID=UPI003F86103A